MKKHKHNATQPGFTIIELIIIIVVITILTALTIVSYKAITDRAHIATLQNDLSAATAQLEKYNYNNSSYPLTEDLTNDGTGLKATDGTVYDYNVYTADNSYCISGTNYGRTYYVTSNNHKPREGSCPKNTIANNWGVVNKDDQAMSVAMTDDGGYAVAGYTYSYGAGMYDAFIAKYTAEGSISWLKTWGGVNRDYGYSLAQTNDGGYIITGKTKSYGNNVGSGTTVYDMFITKLTSDGVVSWSKTWGGSFDDVGNSVVQTSDGGYVVIGDTVSYGSGVGTTYDTFITKFNSSGDLSWSKTWGGANNDYGNSIKQTSDGKYVVTGKTASYGYANTNGDIYLAKFFNDGSLEWSRTLGYDLLDSGEDIIQSSDGSYILLGSTTSYGTSGSSDVILAKFSTDGTPAWTKTWGTTGTDYGYALVESDDGYTVTGVTRAINTLTDTLIAKFSLDGTKIWANGYGGLSHDCGYAISRATYGGYTVVGCTASFYDTDYSDVLFVRVAEDGLVDGCTTSNCLALNIDSATKTVTSSFQTATSSGQSVTLGTPTVTLQDYTTSVSLNVIIDPQFQ